MYRPTFQSKLWLGLMTILFIGLFYWSEKSTVNVRPDDYKAKIDAVKVMENSLQILTDFRLPGGVQSSGDDVKDPLSYTMLGEKDSPITTDEGRIEDKVTVLNPNFAAVVVDLLSQAGVKSGDTIAIALTGSMPGANLASFAAAKALGLHPIVITSVGSSWWGANAPDFTWLDMEQVLYDADVFDFRSIAASAGGGDDQGGLRLSEVGQQLIADAVTRNEITYVHEGSLSANIRGRVDLYSRQTDLANYKAYLNIGGGIASMGHRENSNLIPDGYIPRLAQKNYPNRGVIHHFAENAVPIIQIYDIPYIAKLFDLKIGQLPLPKTGVGPVFENERYDLTIAYFTLGLMFLILIVMKYYDLKKYKWREEKNDMDTIV